MYMYACIYDMKVEVRLSRMTKETNRREWWEEEGGRQGLRPVCTIHPNETLLGNTSPHTMTTVRYNM